MDLLRQLYMLPHWHRNCRIKLSISPCYCILTLSWPVPALPYIARKSNNNNNDFYFYSAFPCQTCSVALNNTNEPHTNEMFVCLLVGCLTSQQHASVSQGRICSDNCTCCHTEIEVADPTFHLTQSQHTDTGPTSPSADPITPGAWQGSHWSANV